MTYWLESFEKGEVAAACFLDMSAAFEIVDHPILLMMVVYPSQG